MHKCSETIVTVVSHPLSRRLSFEIGKMQTESTDSVVRKTGEVYLAEQLSLEAEDWAF